MTVETEETRQTGRPKSGNVCRGTNRNKWSTD